MTCRATSYNNKMGFSTSETVDIAANTTSANLLSGDINEFVSVPSQVNLFAVSSAREMRITMFADSDVAVDDQPIINIGTSLDKSAHLIDSFLVQGGTRLNLRIRNTGTATTIDTLTGVEVNPL